MSGLWTPHGEHHVPREPDGDDAGDLDTGLDAGDLDAGLGDDELEAEVLAELAAARERLAEVPAGMVVANHAMGLFELGAIHLMRQPPDLEQARLAIDAMGAIVDATGDRLGDEATAVRDALAQIRLAFVQLQSAAGEG